jgi:hypothetical protein
MNSRHEIIFLFEIELSGIDQVNLRRDDVRLSGN